MICLRCGYCCKHYFVAIVDNPSKGIIESNLIVHEGSGSACKHLEGDKVGHYSCRIHHYEWYGDTPCSAHSQIEDSIDSPCRVGKYMIGRV